MRKLVLAVMISAGIALVVAGERAAVIPFFAAAMFIRHSIAEPESEFAIQEDGRAKQKRRLKEKLVECFARADLMRREGEIEIRCCGINPPIFQVEAYGYGMTSDRLEKTCKASEPVFLAIRHSFEKEENEDGGWTYRVAFYPDTEINTLSAKALEYAGLEDDPTAFDCLPIGKFEDGTTAYMSFKDKNALISGLPRTGKSVMLRTMITGLCRCDAERIVIMSPKILDYYAFEKRAELVQSTEGMLKSLIEINEEIERRKQYCIDRELTKIEDFSSDIPHITIVMDEYAVVRGSVSTDQNGKQRKIGIEIEQEIFKIVSQGAFAGCQVCIATQRLSSNVISTDLRDICAGNLISFANGSETSDEMIFGDYAKKAPAHDIPVSAKGVGYIFTEGDMEKPRMFKCAFTDLSTARRIASRNEIRKPRG